MDYSLISVRYAKALYELSKEKGITEKVYNDMVLFNEQYQLTSSFRQYLTNPVIRPAEKKKTLTSIFESAIQETTMRFFKVVIENNRATMLDSIARNFIESYKTSNGIKSATIYTAIPLSQEYSQKVKLLLESELNSTIELKVTVKEDLLGGFILMVDGKMMDASILTKLKALKNKLLN